MTKQSKQPTERTVLFRKHYNQEGDSEDSDAGCFTKRIDYNTETQWQKMLRKRNANNPSVGDICRPYAPLAAEESARIRRESKMTEMQLHIRSLEQEVEQHRFMALARHREMARLKALPYLVSSEIRARKLWLVNRGIEAKKKKKARHTEDTLYDSDELYDPGLSDVEELKRYRPVLDDFSDTEADDEAAEMLRKEELKRQLREIDHRLKQKRTKFAPVEKAKATIDKAIDKSKAKAKAKAKAQKPEKQPPKQKKLKAPYIFFAEEMMPVVASEGVAAGPDRMRRIGALWKEQKDKPDGTAKWDQLAADAKTARQAARDAANADSGSSSADVGENVEEVEEVEEVNVADD